MPSVLGADGYNPSAIQYDTEGAPLPPGTTTPAATTNNGGGKEGDSSDSGPAAPKALNISTAAIDNPEKTIDNAIATICKYRTRNDGGNALKLLITFIKNVAEQPTEMKFRSINTEGNAFRNKLVRITLFL